MNIAVAPKKVITYDIRPIAMEDNEAVAFFIRTVLTEFGCTGEGFAIHDPEVDQMCDAYTHARSA